MATATTMVSAGFDDIKQDLIDYLKGQTEFKDYDFAGSRLNVLLDLLAYNTLYIQQYSNAALYEGFMRTASKRSSVVQHAQDMGYSPSAKRASTIDIRLSGTHSLNASIVTMPSGTRFTASVENTDTYDFVNWDTVQMLRNSDNSYSSKFTLVQGTIGQYEITYNSSNKVIIRDTDIDRDYIRVYVNENEWTNWTDKSIVNTTGGGTVYYVRETVNGSTEIYFGEGEESNMVESGGAYDPSFIGGLKPITGQTIRIEFIKTSGESANGAIGVAFADSISNFVVNSITENPDSSADYTGAAGGGEPESMERIRELAPIFRETQRRCVTKKDYETFVSMKYANYVQAIQCYGDSDRPGYAFISIKPKSGLSLTTTQKEDIEDYLSEFNIVTITPKVVDPDYLYVNHKIGVSYKSGSLTEGTTYLESKIVDAISNYYDTEVEIFNSSYHVSKMLTYIDACHGSILGSNCSIDLAKEVTNFFKTPMAGVSFMNPVKSKSVTGSAIKYTTGNYNVYIKSTAGTDSGYSGKLLIGPFAAGIVTSVAAYTGTDFDKTVINGRSLYYPIGTIIYQSGRMDYDLGALNISSTKFDATKVIFAADPTKTDIYVSDGSLCVYEYDLRPEYTTITLEAVN